MTAQHRSPAAGTSSLQLSFLFCVLTLAGFLLASEKVEHWFVIPVLLCGVIIGIDAIDWFRGRVGMFDPAGIIGLLGVYFFFLAPLLHVVWDVWLPGGRWCRCCRCRTACVAGNRKGFPTGGEPAHNGAAFQRPGPIA